MSESVVDSKEDSIAQAYQAFCETNRCEHCGAGEQWTVEGPDGTCISESWTGEEAEYEAEARARQLNAAYELGRESTAKTERVDRMPAIQHGPQSQSGNAPSNWFDGGYLGNGHCSFMQAMNGWHYCCCLPHGPRRRPSQGIAMTPKHLKEIRAATARSDRPSNFQEAMYQLGLAMGHRAVLLKAYDAVIKERNALQKRLRSAECVIRQVSDDTFGEELSVQEFADRSSYDS